MAADQEQTVWICRLVCTFVVCMQQNQFSHFEVGIVLHGLKFTGLCHKILLKISPKIMN